MTWKYTHQNVEDNNVEKVEILPRRQTIYNISKKYGVAMSSYAIDFHTLAINGAYTLCECLFEKNKQLEEKIDELSDQIRELRDVVESKE